MQTFEDDQTTLASLRTQVALERRGQSVPRDHSVSAAGAIPMEIIQHVFAYLAPIDFESMRHTCRDWMSASLLSSLLVLQLKRGGWWSNLTAKKSQSMDVWSMSRYLALECYLADNPSWQHLGRPSDERTPGQPLNGSGNGVLAWGDDDLMNSVGTAQIVQATSLCGKYYLVAFNSTIYIHKIQGEGIQLINKAACGKKVLAMAIAAGSERLAFAVLMQGRSAVYVDFSNNKATASDASPWESSGSIVSIAPATSPILDFETTDGAGITVGDSLPVQRIGACSSHARFQSDSFALSMSDVGEGQSGNRPCHVMYKTICTAEDPPYSIAISPARQCIAFGCKNGVELYWVRYEVLNHFCSRYPADRVWKQVDPITGQDLNRWFRLSTPSDYLYFLPSRRYQDNPSRLRLMSTTRHEALGNAKSGLHSLKPVATSPWFTLRASWHASSPGDTIVGGRYADHRHAIPLSDGHHILFTDSDNGMLSLGCYRQTGSAQRLSRKVVFEPPTDLLVKVGPKAPSLYAARHDMSSGVRIAASYGDHIVFYSVPVDVLRYSTAEQESTLQDPSVPFDELDAVEVLSHPTSNASSLRGSTSLDGARHGLEKLNMLWVHHSHRAAGRQTRCLDEVWPLRISGTYVGFVKSLHSLAVSEDTSEALVVRAFNNGAMATSWRLGGSRAHNLRAR